MKHSHHAYDALKRALDLVSAVVLLVVLSPLMLVAALVVASTLGRPVMFLQKRPGRGGRIFTLCKFRTMREAARDATVEDVQATDEERITRFGRFLRASSIDELPELVNVLLGQMSMVGPRPLLPEYLEKYDSEQARRHEVRPGITGWAQVNGRNAISWDDRFRMDVWYVDNRSFLLDVRILFMTVRTVFAGETASASNGGTMTPFAGGRDVAAKMDDLPSTGKIGRS